MTISLGQTNIECLEKKKCSSNVNNIVNRSLAAAWLKIIPFFLFKFISQKPLNLEIQKKLSVPFSFLFGIHLCGFFFLLNCLKISRDGKTWYCSSSGLLVHLFELNGNDSNLLRLNSVFLSKHYYFLNCMKAWMVVSLFLLLSLPPL